MPAAMRLLVNFLVVIAAVQRAPFVDSFGVPHDTFHMVHTVASTVAHQTHAGELLAAYKHQLQLHPLPTKMATGATLAVCGDAIAQAKASSETSTPYDKRRASSFAVFDMAYRALQHVSFPFIVEHCHGQFATALMNAVLPVTVAASASTVVDQHAAAAMEQTLASQLVIVPFLYYPAFFALTGAIQGLDLPATIERAQEKFLPLMQRNLLFWIPVQFIQFGFIQEDLQIPFLSACGLAWTFILSVMAGAAQKPGDEKAPVEQVTPIPAEQVQMQQVLAAADVVEEDDQVASDVSADAAVA